MKTKRHFNITPITFKLKCLMDIEAGITIPPKGFFIRNAASMRLCYSISNKIQYIHLTTQEQAANFLRKHGIIDSYAIINDEVKMYGKTLITITGEKGQPIQMERLLPICWEDIHLNAAQVQSFAAIHEYEKAGRTIGRIKGKIINMATNYLKTA